ncbi:MAG: hypothetical protein ACREXO_02035, partial [Advenella sp.]
GRIVAQSLVVFEHRSAYEEKFDSCAAPFPRCNWPGSTAAGIQATPLLYSSTVWSSCHAKEFTCSTDARASLSAALEKHILHHRRIVSHCYLSYCIYSIKLHCLFVNFSVNTYFNNK